MGDGHNELAEELKSLRKGRGVRVDRIGERVGPALRRVCGLVRGDSPAEIREKISSTLLAAIDSLPEDLRSPSLAAFALDEGNQQPFYRDRIDQAAERLKRNPRTIRRWVDEGIRHLVEIMESRALAEEAVDDSGPGWYTANLRTLVNLALPAPEAFETRTVVAERDGLHALDLALTVTAPPGGDAPELDIDVFSGGRLAGTRRQASDRVGFELALSRPLTRGERHEFTLRFRMREGREMSPHYVCVPKYRCDHYLLRIKFDPRRPPAAVWRLNSAFQRDLDDPLATGEPAEVDEACEVGAEFRRLARGLAHGFRWSGTRR
ncbi:MAG TPA: hypothetical protein VJT49_28230 [Amycolatopsis sp.]|uniref:hypothetical protein n=1 Tax=Amycolatopsis sp. TaxID=37632 RepID=UPI002B4A46F1|nr:hypothetical protein [Amycolatopsis sp.]HKS48926.1 hypothetical protein [Amycolatopsis sp.]